MGFLALGIGLTLASLRLSLSGILSLSAKFVNYYTFLMKLNLITFNHLSFLSIPERRKLCLVLNKFSPLLNFRYMQIVIIFKLLISYRLWSQSCKRCS